MTTFKKLGIAIEPLDVLFFRDGRPFDSATRAEGGLPLPQTLWGALTTALLKRQQCDFVRLGEQLRLGDAWRDAVANACGAEQRWIADLRTRGPWLARQEAGGLAPAGSEAARVEPLVPAPANIHSRKKGGEGELRTLRPLRQPPPGWSPDGLPPSLRPLWMRGSDATEPASGFLTEEGLKAFLRGDAVEPSALVSPSKLFEYENRTGIEINCDKLTAAESQIYGARFLSLRRGVAGDDSCSPHHVVFYAEAALPDDAPANALADLQLLAWGGEGRRVRATIIEPYAWPAAPARADGRQRFCLLTTPGLFRRRWPRVIEEQLVAAAVPNPIAVSGWDLARGGPKPNRFAAPAGSVYFCEPLPDLTNLSDSLCDGDFDRQQGWGCYLEGVWTDA